MRTTLALFLTCLALSAIQLIYAQSIHVVKVGDTGSFYDPQVTSARAGDLVSFQWTGTFHTVTQSSFDKPCTPLPGGFDSGFAGNPPQQSITPEWNLTITDDTQPIWFFCKVTVPILHCTQGMVGAINAEFSNANHSYINFSQNAKAIINPVAIPDSSPVLSGVGAFATSTPLPAAAGAAAANGTSTSINSTSSIPTSTSILSSTSSDTPAASQTQQSASNSGGLSLAWKGGIIGGSVGLFILLTLLVLLFMSYRRGRRYRKEATAVTHLRSKVSREMVQNDRLDLLYDGGDLEPPPLSAQHVLHLDRSHAHVPSVSDSLERDGGSPSINIKELAAEIAKNIRQDINLQERERSGMSLDMTSLSSVPEQVITDAVSRSGSSRARPGRELPRPPQTRGEVRSVDTLPAYVPGSR